MIPYTKNIEKVILDHFERANESIIIVVAWFTNETIVQKLIQLKRRNESLSIEILVDENYINQKYFFKLFSDDLRKEGIEIKKQRLATFNHNKFSIIDEEIIITGSYNFTQRANKNLEGVIVCRDKRMARYFTRVFRFFTVKGYIDENVEVLFEDFKFANELISSYYPFSRKLYAKIKDKILLGYCFTHDNGFFDEVSYEPGIVFNPKYYLCKKLVRNAKWNQKFDSSVDLVESNLIQEFPLPISKDTIKNYRKSSFQNYQFNSHKDIAIEYQTPINFNKLVHDFEKTEAALVKFYKQKFEKSFSKSELKYILKGDIDIIVEDYIWINNFAPFLNDEIVENIYCNANA